jgi:hypothetical protein
MHSYSQPDPELIAALEEGLREKALARHPDEPLGPTGRFPEGKLTALDEGETRFAIGVVSGNVVMNFGSPTQAIGLNPSQALGLADLLRKHAKALLPKTSHKARKGR